MRYYKSSSTVKPIEWDLQSSKQKVYHNYNIMETSAIDKNPIMYNYDVEEYSRIEYLEYKDQVQSAAAADTDCMLVDMAYNLTLLELGL